MKDLLYTYAHDSDGNLVHIDDAQDGQRYFCPEYGYELEINNSHIPEGHKNHKRRHFAKKSNINSDCSESLLHKLFKERCSEYLRNKISADASVPFEWKCEKCGDVHKGNMLKKAVRVETELNLRVCQPDIALLDKDGKVVIVIEVVAYHPPEDSVLKYYEENKIVCLQIKVKEDEDCDNIEEKLFHPLRVSYLCPIRCEKCGGKRSRSKLVIIAGVCPRCGQKIKLAMIKSNWTLFPRDFNAEEIRLAQSFGVTIRKQYDNKMNMYYLANTCGQCNGFVSDLDMALLYWPQENEVDLGFKCTLCIRNMRKKYFRENS
ncbi:MAG: hypothetical protein J6Q29_03355 [Alistipes sp.]|nr:hypothetical protein [Alistipes sp.]